MKLFENEDVVELTHENRELLQSALKLYIESQDDCAICYDAPTAPVITHCKHVFCRPCILEALKRKSACPLCRNKLDENCLLEPAPEEDADGEDQEIDAETHSSKTEALIQIVRATLKKPGSKIIIFSQWTCFLNIIQKRLEYADLTFTRIDGKMTADKRDKAMYKLDNEPETRIMLASLAVCSVGLNLVSADTVILADSCKYINTLPFVHIDSFRAHVVFLPDSTS